MKTSKQLNILYEFKTPLGYLGMGYRQQDLPHIFEYIQTSDLFSNSDTITTNCIKFLSTTHELYKKLKNTSGFYFQLVNVFLKDTPVHLDVIQKHYSDVSTANDDVYNMFSITFPKEHTCIEYLIGPLSDFFQPNTLKFLQSNPSVKVVFFDTWEGAYTYEDTFFDNFHSFVTSYNLDKEQICFVTNSFNIESRYTEYLLRKTKKSFMVCKTIPFLLFHTQTSTLGSSTVLDYDISYKRSKYYLNLNRNTGDRLHRADLVLGLIEKNIFDKGYVSFLKSEKFDKFCNVKGNEKYKKLIGDKYPFKVDYYDPDLVATLLPLHLDKSIKKTWTDTYFSVVSETSANNTHAFITEKTVKPIYFYHPFIIWGNPYSLRYLREIGFKTFPEFFDETYDTVEDAGTRLSLILDNIKRLCSKDLREIHDMYKSAKPKLVHNHNLLRKMSTGNTLIDELVDLWK